MAGIPKGDGGGRVWVRKDNIFRSVDEDGAEKFGKVIEGKPLPDQGVFPARCYAIYDIGTQHVDYMHEGKHIDKWQRKVIIFWEIPEFRVMLKMSDDSILDRPLSINKEYTFTQSEKGNLMKDLKSWLGSATISDPDFQMNSLIGLPAMLNVDQTKSRAGKLRAQVNTIMPLPKGMEAPKAENDPQSFFFEEDFDLNSDKIEVPDFLPEWIAKKVLQSAEVNDRLESGQATIAEADDEPDPDAEYDSMGNEDNLPF